MGFKSPNPDYVYTGQQPVKKREPKPEDDIKVNPYTQFEQDYLRFERDWEKQWDYIKKEQEKAAYN